MASVDAIAKRFQVPIICGLLASIAYFQGSGIGSLVAEHLPAEPALPHQATLPKKSSAGLAPPKSGAVILSRNAFDSVTGPLTGKPPPPPVASAATPPPDGKAQLPPCGSGNVILITGSSDPAYSFAVIASGNESKMRRIGDEIDGRKVESILGERVVMASGSTRCQLTMHEENPTSVSAKGPTRGEPSTDLEPPSPTGPIKAPVGQGIRKVSETEYVIEQNSADKLAQMERAFRQSGRTVPGSGLRLHRASSTTVLGQLGLQKGDIIKSINGNDMTDLDASMTAYNQMKGAKNVQIVLERDGKPVTMDYAVK